MGVLAELLASRDSNRAAQIQAAFEAGERPAAGENLAIALALQPDAPDKFDLLLILKFFGVDFDEIVGDESATSIMQQSSPSLLRALTIFDNLNLWLHYFNTHD